MLLMASNSKKKYINDPELDLIYEVLKFLHSFVNVGSQRNSNQNYYLVNNFLRLQDSH